MIQKLMYHSGSFGWIYKKRGSRLWQKNYLEASKNVTLTLTSFLRNQHYQKSIMYCSTSSGVKDEIQRFQDEDKW